ncbi:MAG TPA: hypothetical protein PLX89_27975 [Verrucomicrobiota bacterium]|nr:hypothetical protein [Verrucomicrobiota bacterium]
MIEQMAAMLARIVAKEKAGQLIEARRDLDAVCVQTIGLDLTGLKAASPEAVAERLNAMGGLRHVRAITLAELLLHDAKWNDAETEDRPAEPGEVHAFCLLADSIEALGIEDRVHYRAKLESLARRLGQLRAHPYLEERLRALGISDGGGTPRLE